MSKNILNEPKFVAGLLGFLTLILYWPALQGGFLELDDDHYVSGNPFVQQGITPQSLSWAITEVHESYWLPVTWLSFIADRAIQGPGPAGFHLTNVVLHSANVMLLFLIAFRLTGNLGGSVLLAALFGWHPLRVEAVAWISSRKDVLSSLFGLLAILAYERYVRARRAEKKERARAIYCLVLFSLILALMAKPMWVTLPFVLLLLDGWPLRRWGGAGSRALAAFPGGAGIPAGAILEAAELPRLPSISGSTPYERVGRERFCVLLLEKIPLLLVASIFVFITLSTHRSSGAMPEIDTASLSARLPQIPANYGRYLWKMICPRDLTIRYPMVQVPLWQCVALALLGIVWTLGGFWCFRRWPWVATGWLWFLGTFAPVIGVVQIGSADFADRFTYVPSMGISLLVAGLIYPGTARGHAPVRLVATVLLLTGCALATRHQMRFWSDGETLFRRALQVTRNNATAHNALGRTLEKQGRWPEAMMEYEASLKIAPQFGQAQANLGNVLGLLHRYDEAAVHFQAAIKSTPNDGHIRSNYGSILYQSGQKAEGVFQLREAIRLNRRLADAQFNLGHALLEMGDAAGALPHFVSAARINPHDDAALFQAGRINLARGNRELARTFFEAAIECKPDDQSYSQALQELMTLEKKP